MPRKTNPKKPGKKAGAQRLHAIMKIDGHEEAILGMASSFGGVHPVLVYDSAVIIQTLQDRDGMTEEEAVEFFEYNIAGAYVGTGTPLFLERKPDDMSVDEWAEACAGGEI